MTVGNVHAEFVVGDVRHNMVTAFVNPYVSGFYIVAVLALGLHLYHGLWSFFQSMGWTGPRLAGARRKFAVAFAVLVSAGFMAVPVAILIRLVR